MACSIECTMYFFPLNAISFPTDLSDATGNNSVTGKFLSDRTSNIFVPTNPVAPTTAIFILYFLFFVKLIYFYFVSSSFGVSSFTRYTPSGLIKTLR